MFTESIHLLLESNHLLVGFSVKGANEANKNNTDIRCRALGKRISFEKRTRNKLIKFSVKGYKLHSKETLLDV